jgi:hypothetical protein
MKKSGLSAFFIFLIASNRDASDAFLSEGFGSGRYNGESFLPESKKNKPVQRISENTFSLEQFEKNVGFAQDRLEMFSNKFVNHRISSEPFDKDDDHVTFMKINNLDSELFYSNKSSEKIKIPASVKGKIDTYKQLSEDKSFCSPYILSTGTKSIERSYEKSLKSPGKEIRDLARLTIFTESPKELYEFVQYVSDYHQSSKKGSIFAIDDNNPLIMRDWNQKESGFFSAKIQVPIKTPTGSVYSEVMFRPRQKNMEIDTISHTAYEVAREGNSYFYNSKALRKWNLVVREAKDSGIKSMDKIINKEVRPNGAVEPITSRKVDTNTLMLLFSGVKFNNESPLERRQKEMSHIQRELNKESMRAVCCDDKWSPQSIAWTSRNYDFQNGIVKQDAVSKFQGCEVDSMMCR